MRTFIAIPLPKEVKEELIRLQNLLYPELKASKAKDFHLTLKFLGETDDNQVEEIKNKLNSIKFEPFELTLTNINFFPNENYIKVIWVGTTPDENIKDLHKQIDNATPNIKKDNRFHPHLTLFRVKFIKDKEKFKELIKNLNINKITFKVTAFHLYKSTLTLDGPVYDILM